MTIASERRVPVFAALAAALLAAEWGIVHTAAFTQASLLPFAVLGDLLLVLPALYWFLVLRPAGRKALEAVSVLGLGVLVASVLLAGQASLKTFLLVAGGLTEIASVAFLVQKLRVASKQFHGAEDDDLLLRLNAIPERWLRILGLELIVFYYAFVGPRLRRSLMPNEFSYTEKSGLGGLLFALGFVTVVEGLVVHFLLRQWRPVAGWIFTGLHVYTLFWLAAAYQAARLRPLVVTDSTLLLRISLLWTAEIPLSQLASVEAIKAMPDDKIVLRAAFGDDPKLLLTLSEPVELQGLLGIRKQVTKIALYVDEPEKLQAALR